MSGREYVQGNVWIPWIYAPGVVTSVLVNKSTGTILVLIFQSKCLPVFTLWSPVSASRSRRGRRHPDTPATGRISYPQQYIFYASGSRQKQCDNLGERKQYRKTTSHFGSNSRHDISSRRPKHYALETDEQTNKQTKRQTNKQTEEHRHYVKLDSLCGRSFQHGLLLHYWVVVFFDWLLHQTGSTKYTIK